MWMAHHWFVLPCMSVACICTADSDVPHQGKVQQPGCIGNDCPLELETKVNRQRRQLPNCTDPMAPTSVQFNPPTVMIESGRQRWRYNFTWEELASMNCGSISFYKTRFPMITSPVVSVSTSERMVYTDGNIEVSFFVYAVNTAGRESPTASTTITSGLLRPQIAPTSVNLNPDNSDCVTLYWQPPEYPNGDIINYKYTCGDEGAWESVDEQLRDIQICSLSPNEQVKCSVKAVNSKGESDSETVFTTTKCAAPVLPQDISGYVTEDKYLPSGSSYHCRKITIQVPAEDIDINCKSIIRTRTWFQGTDISTAVSDTLTDLDSLTSYTVLYQVTNDKYLDSVPREVTVKTGELEPLAPQVSVVSLNLSCVTVNWIEPSSVRGVITKYQSRCATNGQLSQEIYTTFLPGAFPTVCSFQHAVIVTCEVRASTAVGYGPSAEDVTTMHCGRPSGLSLTINDSVYNASDGTEMATLYLYNHELQSNCDSIDSYTVLVTTSDGTLVGNRTELNSTLTNLLPYTTYNITVEAINNENISESAVFVWVTSEAKPLDPPALQLELNSSCAILHISSPQQPNGLITHYKYSCKNDTAPGPVTPMEVEAAEIQLQPPIVCGFKPVSNVVCDVSAVNSAGESPEISVTGQTSLKLTQQVSTSDLVEVLDDSGVRTLKITVYQMDFEDVTLISSVYKVVVGLEDKENSTGYHSVFADNGRCNLAYLDDFSSAKDLGYKCYIAAEILGSVIAGRNFTLTLGDGGSYRSYYNAPLEQNMNYSLMVAIDVHLIDDKKITYYLPEDSVWSSPPEDPSATGCSGSCVGGAVGGVFGSLIVICIIIVSWKFRRYLRCCIPVRVPVKDVQQATDAHKVVNIDPGYEDPDLVPTSSPPVGKVKNISILLKDQQINETNPMQTSSGKGSKTSPSRLPEQGEEKDYSDAEEPYDTAEDPGASKPLISTTKPPQSDVQEYEESREEMILADYKKLELRLVELDSCFTRALADENLKKNRTTYILPDDEHVVSIVDEGYINAVFVNSYDKDNHIIATQLPLADTVADFWQMIEKQKVRAIIQLDRNEHIEGLMYGDVEGIEYTTVESGDYMTRMSLSWKGQPVTVFLVHTWSDDGEDKSNLPNLDTLLCHIHIVNKHQMQSGDGKICVMDTDGCSRCGVFIAAYNMLLKFKDTDDDCEELTVYKIILNARTRRRQFLYTLKQHEFMYKLEEHFITEYDADYKTFTKAMILGNKNHI